MSLTREIESAADTDGKLGIAMDAANLVKSRYWARIKMALAAAEEMATTLSRCDYFYYAEKGDPVSQFRAANGE